MKFCLHDFQPEAEGTKRVVLTANGFVEKPQRYYCKRCKTVVPYWGYNLYLVFELLLVLASVCALIVACFIFGMKFMQFLTFAAHLL